MPFTPQTNQRYSPNAYVRPVLIESHTLDNTLENLSADEHSRYDRAMSIASRHPTALAAREMLHAAKAVEVLDHSERVGKLAVMVAVRLNLGEERAVAAGVAGLAHDGGKAMLQDGDTMSDHLAHSVELAKRTWAPFLALLAINYHHAQNTDSSHNYIADRTLIPKTYAECQGAQILAAVDAFDFFRTSGPRHPIARDADGAVRGIEQQVEVDTEIVRAIRELTTPIRK